jgi:hypothetical protein
MMRRHVLVAAALMVVAGVAFSTCGPPPVDACVGRKAGDLVTLEGPTLGPMSHTVALSVYFGDPDGNRVELFVDTPWYITQPTREPLDLSLSDTDLLASVEAFARKQPGFRPRAEWSEEIRRKIEAATPA